MNIKFTFDEINDALVEGIYGIINDGEMDAREKITALYSLDYDSNEMIDTLASIVGVDDSFIIELEDELFNTYWEYALPALIDKCLDIENPRIAKQQ